MVARLTPLLTFVPSWGADTTAPIIIASGVSPITATSEMVSWKTDEASSSRVDYGTTAAYGSTVEASGRVTVHNMSISGLLASTLYHYRMRSTDLASNEVMSADQTFTTASPPGSLTIDSGPSASVALDGTSAVITWTCSGLCNAQVRYGLTSSYGLLSAFESGYVYTTQAHTLSDLTPSQTYKYRVWSRDAAGNEVLSAEFTFDTTPT